MIFEAASYPGWRPAGPVRVLPGGATLAIDVDDQRRALERLVWSLAHGSNACPDRLADKGLGDVGAVLLPAVVQGHVMAWEARRSRHTGSVPLTLLADTDATRRTWVLGLPEHALAALDASEERGRNYDLAIVGDAIVADRWRVRGLPGWTPTSRTRVLAMDGRPLTWPEHDQAAAVRCLDVLGDQATGPGNGRVSTLTAPPFPDIVEGWPRVEVAELPVPPAGEAG